MYKFAVAYIDNCHPLLFTDDIMGAISCLSHLTEFRFGKTRILGHLADGGHFIHDNFIIIDFECKEDLSHIRVSQNNGERVPFDELVDGIKKNIRNIQISKIVD